MSDGDDRDPNAVGYKRPPAEHRFRKGQSGNPRGRPKKAKPAARSPISLLDCIADDLARTMTVGENGGQVEMSARQVISRMLVHKAAKGDARAFKELVRLQAEIDRRDRASYLLTAPMSDDPMEASRQYQEMMRGGRD